MMEFSELARAYQWPPETAILRRSPEDFQVQEELGFEPDGAGEHLWLQVRKRSLTTPEAARRIARLLDVSPRQVSWSGLKDRNAITTQWLCAHLPGRPAGELADLQEQCEPDLEIRRAVRHGRKLRPGTHQCNQFEIHLHDCSGTPGELSERLAQIAKQGTPNYFGEQRFGNQQSNLAQRRRGRQGRAMHLSALRALLFNAVLDARVRAGTWNRVMAGDALQFADGNSFFSAQGDCDPLQARVDAGELHVTGPLPGQAGKAVEAEAAILEEQVLCRYPGELAALQQAGARAARRALRLMPERMDWEFVASGVLVVRFTLRSGGYATSLLREIFLLDDARGRVAA